MKKSIKKAVVLSAAMLTLAFPAVFAGCKAMGNPMDSSISSSMPSSSEWESTGSSSTGAWEEEVSWAAVLRKGSKGDEVKGVQTRLKRWGYYNGSVDGIFGESTKKAVIAFQKKNGLTADGVVGKSTYKALGMNSSYQALVNSSNASGNSSSQGVNGFSSSEVYLLARTIYAEGRGEPYTGQVAIGAVITRNTDFAQDKKTSFFVLFAL